MISVSLNLLRVVLWPNMWSILENVPRAVEKNMYSTAIRWSVLYMSTRSNWYILLLKSSGVFFYLTDKIIYIYIYVQHIYYVQHSVFKYIDIAEWLDQTH